MKLFGTILAGVLAFILFIVLMLGLGWIATGNDFFLYKYFAPKQEAVRRARGRLPVPIPAGLI